MERPPLPEPTWRVEHDAAHGRLLATTAGGFTRASFVAMVAEMLARAAALGVRKVVFDHRAMRPRVATSEIYLLQADFERLGWQRDMRVAVVYDPARRAAEDFEFFASIAVSRAFKYSLFTTLDEAYAWVDAGG